MDAEKPASARDETPPPTLSLAAFALVLGVVLAIFFLLNPLWERPDVEAVDANIWLSYAPIPLLVLAALAWERKLRAAAWFLESLKVTLAKFGVTYLVANLVWFVDGPPPVTPETLDLAPAAAAGVPGVGPSHASDAQPVDPARTGRLAGVVRDASGAPLADAWVWVSSGLRRWAFDVPAEPAVLHHDGDGYAPRFVVVRTGQPFVLRSAPDALHTAELVDADGRLVGNVPALAGGEHRMEFGRELGLVTVRCRVGVHAEDAVHLLVLGHPFVTRSGPDGAFAFDGVPAGALAASVWTGTLGVVEGEVALPAGGEATLELTLR